MEATDSQTQRIVRSDIWYDDGSIVIQAELTQYKVHKTILAQNSTIFYDLFSLPMGAIQDEVDGCPLVMLHDSPQDIGRALSMLYNARHPVPEFVSFEDLAAMLRIGRKYQIKQLWEEGVSRLTVECPSDRLEYVDGQPSTVPGGWRRIVPGPGDQRGRVLSWRVYKLAKEMGLRRVLPCIMHYIIVCAETELDAEEMCKQDLSMAEGLAFFKARQSMKFEYMRKVFASYTLLPAAECSTPASCKTLMERVRFDYAENMAEETYFPMGAALFGDDFGNDEFAATSSCGPCNYTLHQALYNGGIQAWENLPLHCGLPPWDKLENATM